MTITRLWKRGQLQPWRSETHLFGIGPQLVVKVTDIVALEVATGKNGPLAASWRAVHPSAWSVDDLEAVMHVVVYKGRAGERTGIPETLVADLGDLIGLPEVADPHWVGAVAVPNH